VTVKLLYDGGKSKTVRFRPKVTLGLGGRIKTLPDTIVKIKKVGSNFVFRGKGFGHGIGYMQHGGQAMAKAGHSYRDILQFYYPGTNIVNYWN
jgi:stage II sporulation protein D